ALSRLLADPSLRLRIAAGGLASAPRFDRMSLAGAWAEAYDGMPARPGEATITAGPARPMRSA
ncbi:MAG: hypothetical protein JWQ07_5385, partial [Ramlibacter sp.]|nr:hypothetical protein [Ramlibacter sp.]